MELFTVQSKRKLAGVFAKDMNQDMEVETIQESTTTGILHLLMLLQVDYYNLLDRAWIEEDRTGSNWNKLNRAGSS